MVTFFRHIHTILWNGAKWTTMIHFYTTHNMHWAILAEKVRVKYINVILKLTFYYMGAHKSVMIFYRKIKNVDQINSICMLDLSVSFYTK